MILREDAKASLSLIQTGQSRIVHSSLGTVSDPFSDANTMSLLLLNPMVLSREIRRPLSQLDGGLDKKTACTGSALTRSSTLDVQQTC